jgi:hypothetical protein
MRTIKIDLNKDQLDLIQDCIALVIGNKRHYGDDIRELLELMDSIDKQLIIRKDGSK